VLTEIKAASIEVVVEEAARRGLPVVFVQNVPQEASGVRCGELGELMEWLVAMARERFERGA
jgi:predicted GTPase